MKAIDPELLAYIKERILPLYREHDAAHGPEHVRTVIENSLELAKGRDVDVDMVYTVAAYHDVGIRFGRKDHELTSGKWLWEDEALERWFTPGQRQVMREAVEDHRASRKEPPRSIYGCIVSEADRDVDPERILRRTVEFGLAHEPGLSSEGQLERALAHLQEKYGEQGYLRLWMPCPKNEEGLRVVRLWLSDGTAREKCKKYLEAVAQADGSGV